jgi:manganese transport protein
MNYGFRFLEAFIIALFIVIFGCFAVQIVAAQPSVGELLRNLVIPSPEILTNPAMLYVAIGIIGATVMPHNLYLHSSIVQTRDYAKTPSGKRDAIKWATIDSTIALMLALFVNGAILIVAAVAFHNSGHQDVADIAQAFQLLSPLPGLGVASLLFAIALLASGVNSTVTATLAGQIIMEGFLRLRIPHWARRLITRAIAIVPVLIVTALYGSRGTGRLLVFSQVILSMQLPFAVIPLVHFVSDRKKMGEFAISRNVAILSWIVAAMILILNVKLLYDTIFNRSATG